MRRATSAGVNDTIEQSRERCSRLAGFLRECWHVINPLSPFQHNWHIDFVAEHLEAISHGTFLRMGLQNRLRINMPGRHLKSLLTSVAWQAWEWGPLGKPETVYLTTTYREDLTLDHARMTRDLIESDWYQARWGNLVRLKTRGERQFANDAGGARRSVPFGSLTGGGGNRLVIDDPHSTDTVESEAERETVTRRFREVVPFRINDPRTDAIVVVMHRLHESDICGVIDRLRLPYTSVILPTEFEPGRACVTPIGRDPRTRAGELLFPERFSREVVERLKAESTGYGWSAQQQQNPVPRQGAMFDRHKIEVVGAAPARVADRVRAWDLASTLKKPGSDPSWTCGVLMSRDVTGLYYVEDVARFRESGDDVERAVLNYAKADNRARPTRVRLPQDPGAGGKQWASYLTRALAGFSVKAVPVSGTKEIRAEPLASQWRAGNVKLVKGGWNDAFMDELCSFPAGQHNDQVDAAGDAFGELALSSGYDPTLSWVR